MANSGTVYLVGAGPGDPGLITLRGIECLQRADVVLYDYLVNVSVLQHVPPHAETIALGRQGRISQWDQAAINARLVAEAQAGRTVVRLKCGDPLIFGRAAEELQALTAAGVRFEIVPGITAALAAGAYAGIPLTHRDHASAVALLTGQENSGKSEPRMDFTALARFPGTLVIYMGVTSARHWTQRLIDAGLPRDCPVALICRCSWPDQQVLRCRLDELADRLEPDSEFASPAVAVVGSVSQLDPALDWFGRRPLFGRRVLVTRPRHQAGELERALRDLGADVVLQPAIEITDPDDWQPVDHALRRLADFDYLVFASANGVQRLLTRLCAIGLDLRALGSLRLAAIGPGTAEALAAYHLRADVVPEQEYRAEGLLNVLRQRARGQRFLLARASRGRELLADELRAAGAEVEQIVVYRSIDVTQPDDAVVQLLDRGQIDWLTVTSSSIAGAIVRLLGPRLVHTRLVSISPVTSATLRGLGVEPALEATSYTMDGVLQAILQDAGPSAAPLSPDHAR